MTTTPVATAATGQPEWARCRGRGEQSLHCAFVARFPVVGSSKAGRIGLVYGRFSHQLEAHAAMLLVPLPLIMGIIGALAGLSKVVPAAPSRLGLTKFNLQSGKERPRREPTAAQQLR